MVNRNDGAGWVKNWSTNNYTDMTAKASFDGYQYKCVITDANGGTLESNVVTFTVKKAAFTITAQPESVEAEVGANVKFTVIAEGEGLTYQWYVDRNDGAGWVKNWSTGKSTNMTVKESFNGYQYKCVITDANGNVVESEIVTLTVA